MEDHDGFRRLAHACLVTFLLAVPSVALGGAVNGAHAAADFGSGICAESPPSLFVDRGTTHGVAIDCLTFHRDRAGSRVARGFDERTFGTNEPVTRGQVASMVYRFLTVADPRMSDGGDPPDFPDARSSVHADAIGALGRLGILDGRADGSFGPDEPLSRGAAASAVAAALEVAGLGLPDRPRVSFDDQGDTHARTITQLAELGVTTGVTPNSFAPFDDVTRGQLITLLARSAQLLADDDAWAADPRTGRPHAYTPPPPLPRPTPAATHPPRRIAVLGDSITQASGATRAGEGFRAVMPGGTRPVRSWATGTAPGLDSVLQRLRAGHFPGATGENLSVNWARMADAVDQAEQVPIGTDLILVQLGGNDLCRPTPELMTSPSLYESQTRAALKVLSSRHPAATIQLSSVPDIYRLWEVMRDDGSAVALWNGLGPLPALVPCQSLLANAGSDSPSDQARRDGVRTRSQSYNARLQRACAEVLRCRHDNGALWQVTNDPSRFGAEDISRVDFFHPSFAGQRKLAEVAWEAGPDHARTEAPTLELERDGAAAVVRAAGASEHADVAGIEYRHLRLRERRPAWSARSGRLAVVGLDPTAHALEVRAIDVDGNVSAGEVLDLR